MVVRARVLFLAGALTAATGAWLGAQVFRGTPVDPPIVMSGPDIGFRITAYDRGIPVGELVVNRDGKWVPVREAGRPSRLTMR